MIPNELHQEQDDRLDVDNHVDEDDNDRCQTTGKSFMKLPRNHWHPRCLLHHGCADNVAPWPSSPPYRGTWTSLRGGGKKVNFPYVSKRDSRRDAVKWRFDATFDVCCDLRDAVSFYGPRIFQASSRVIRLKLKYFALEHGISYWKFFRWNFVTAWMVAEVFIRF